MFLSYVVVPVFALTILLNFFCLYSPIDSQQVVPDNFTKCDGCLKSSCHKDSQGTCALAPDNTTFICFSCVGQLEDNPLFPDEDTCLNACSDASRTCVCNGPCYSCVATGVARQSVLKCTIPTFAVDDSCTAIPYGPPADTEAPPENVPE